MKSQSLIRHRFSLIKQIASRGRENGKIKSPSGNIPVFLGGIPSIFVSMWALKTWRPWAYWAVQAPATISIR
jgi:hypothetical protein